MSTTPEPYTKDSQMTGLDPRNLPRPTAPVSGEPSQGTTTIQRVGYAIGALIVGTVIYMLFFV